MQRRYEPSQSPSVTAVGAASRAFPETAIYAADASDPCDLCGGSTIEIKCKITCRNCGFTRDCSDP